MTVEEVLEVVRASTAKVLEVDENVIERFAAPDFGLRRIVQAAAKLLALVKELVNAQLVVEESADRFAFRPALTREAIRARLLARERVALHRAIASSLERRSDDRSGDADGDLAYHSFNVFTRDHARAQDQREPTCER